MSIMHFEKITREQWMKDMVNLYSFESLSEENLEKINKLYDGNKLPKRATKYSAGYDFYVSGDTFLPVGNSGVILTGVRWVCDKEEDKNKVLQIYPRSGIGFKTGLRLMNTVGIIDADYWEGNNEGHIMVKLYNPMDSPLHVKDGDAIVQGVITEYHTCDDEEEIVEKRTGGMGSTDKKQSEKIGVILPLFYYYDEDTSYDIRKLAIDISAYNG